MACEPAFFQGGTETPLSGLLFDLLTRRARVIPWSFHGGARVAHRHFLLFNGSRDSVFLHRSLSPSPTVFVSPFEGSKENTLRCLLFPGARSAPPPPRLRRRAEFWHPLWTDGRTDGALFPSRAEANGNRVPTSVFRSLDVHIRN